MATVIDLAGDSSSGSATTTFDTNPGTTPGVPCYGTYCSITMTTGSLSVQDNLPAGTAPIQLSLAGSAAICYEDGWPDNYVTPEENDDISISFIYRYEYTYGGTLKCFVLAPGSDLTAIGIFAWADDATDLDFFTAVR